MKEPARIAAFYRAFGGLRPLWRRMSAWERAWALAAAAAWLAGAWLRLGRIGLTPFGLDEGIASILTVQLVRGGQIPLVGVKTSLHFYNPPLLPWLLAPWFAISRDPALATWFVAALGCAAAAGMGWCAWRLAGRNRIAGAAAIVMASLIPFWIEHSRRLWGHALILPFGVAALYFAIRWILDGRRWAAAGAIACVAAGQALHFSAVLWWIPLAMGAALHRPRAPLAWKPLLAGALIAMLWYGPYAIHLAKTDFLDVRIIAAAMTGKAQGAGPSIRSPGWSFFTLLSTGLHNDAIGGGSELAHNLSSAQVNLDLLAMFIIFATLIWAAIRIVMKIVSDVRGKRPRNGLKKSRTEGMDVLILWGLAIAAIPPVIYAILKVTFVPAYLLPAAPGVVLLCSGMLARAHETCFGTARGETPCGRWMARAAIYIAVLWWAKSSLGTTNYVNTLLAAANPSTPYFTTLKDQREAVDWIASDAGDGPMLVVQGARREAGLDYNFFYLFWARTNEPERFQSRDDWRKFYIVRDSKDRLPPAYAAALDALPQRQFGNLTVYSSADRAAYSSLTRANP